MNNGYMILSDGSVAVTNEKGIIKKRNFEDKQFINETFILENSIETINSKIQDLNKQLGNAKGVVYLCKNMLKVQPIIIFITSFFGFVVGGVFSSNFILNGLYYGLYALSASSVVSIVGSIYLKIMKSKYSKQIIGLEGSIERGQGLKSIYEEELTDIRKRVLQNQKTDYKVNTPVSLTTKNNDIRTQIENDLSDAYKYAVNNRQKKLVLK